MPERSPAEPPSRWTVINDYSKTVVTLGAGLLGFLAAFIDKLQIADAPSGSRCVFLLAIVFLLAAIAFALAVAGQLDRYLRICAAGDPNTNPPGAATKVEWETERPKAIWRCKLFANLSYLCLFLAAFALAWFTIARVQSLKPVTKTPPNVTLLNELPKTAPPEFRNTFESRPICDRFAVSRCFTAPGVTM